MRIVSIEIVSSEFSDEAKEGYVGWMVRILRPQGKRWDHFIETTDIEEVFEYIRRMYE